MPTEYVFLALAVLSTVFAGGCAGSLARSSARVPCPAGIEAPALFPGDTWAYHYNDGRRWRQTYDAVTEDGLLRGQGAYPRATFFFDRAHTLRKVFLDGAWITWETPEFPEIGKPALEFPLTVGKRWRTVWYQYAFDQVTQESWVAGCETVTVPAGTFLAVRIEVSRWNTRNASGTFDPYTLWYSPSVKYWVKGRGGSSTVSDPFREFELREFSIGGGTPLNQIGSPAFRNASHGSDKDPRAFLKIRGESHPVSELPIYKAHRIHTRRLFSGVWVSTIVNVGTRTVPTKDALTETVTRVPGEYESEDRAIQAARAYVDHEVREASV